MLVCAFSRTSHGVRARTGSAVWMVTTNFLDELLTSMNDIHLLLRGFAVVSYLPHFPSQPELGLGMLCISAEAHPRSSGSSGSQHMCSDIFSCYAYEAGLLYGHVRAPSGTRLQMMC